MSSTSLKSAINSISDAAFNKQVDATRVALSNFNTISKLNAPGPAKAALEELITTTVRPFLANHRNSY
jgi:hypothetical protein